MAATNRQSQIPLPRPQERPAAYADRLGAVYSRRVAVEQKRAQGQYFTPLAAASFMAAMCRTSAPQVRLLDPGAGAGVLACAVGEAVAAHRVRPQIISLVAYEADAVLARYLASSLTYAQQWLRAAGVTFNFEICPEDFVLRNAEVLADTPTLFPAARQRRGEFDLIVANPPYFKLPKADPRAQAAATIVCGQPNIYAIFMAISAELLRAGGELVFITPRSYAAGNYFQLFRERFFARVRPAAIHLFDSRRAAFDRDDILQENIILRARRVDGGAPENSSAVAISRSSGTHDLAQARARRVPLSAVLDLASKDKLLRIPVAAEDDEIAQLVRAWPGRLHAYGWEISTGPVVPFRAVPLLHSEGQVPQTHAPLLWMQNVAPMRVTWPVTTRNKAQYITADEQAHPLLVKNRNYVLLRRFSAKEAARRLVAAPLLAETIDAPLIGLENHLNYVHCPGGSLSAAEACGLAALFNSSLLDRYFRIFNGNTQVSATELRALPLPPLALMKALGERLLADGVTSGLEAWVDEWLVKD